MTVVVDFGPWTLESYLDGARAGDIDARRTTLLHGWVGDRVTPGGRHTFAVSRLITALVLHLSANGFIDTHEVRSEAAVHTGRSGHHPEPDIAVAPIARGGLFDLAACFAIIEVADSTVGADENAKHALMYNRFEPYWVIGLGTAHSAPAHVRRCRGRHEVPRHP